MSKEMKRAVRKLLQARPLSKYVNVVPIETTFAELGKCKQNSYNLVFSNEKRYDFVTGWVVHETENNSTVVHGHWWNYDNKTNKHVDSTQKFFNADVSYIVDMDIGKILSKYYCNMGDEKLEILFDKHPQVVGDLLLYNDEWYAWDEDDKDAFYKLGKHIDLQQLFAIDMIQSAKRTMKPEVFSAFKDYAKRKYQ
jgi:hypothetical protein